MTMFNLVRFLREARILGGFLGIDSIEEIISKILVPTDSKEH